MFKTLVFLTALALSLSTSTVPAAQKPPQDPAKGLQEARQALEAHEFEQAFKILEPFLDGDLSTPVKWEITAEAGRAAFSMGQLEEARKLLRLAVAARPGVAETAVYLEATSYLLGDRKQALMIFEALLKSRVPDLYLAVTLPGEVRFLADPDVRALMTRYAMPLDIRPDTGEFLGLHLGQSRAEVSAELGLPPSKDSVLLARAGPELIWVFSFDELGMLQEAAFHADHLQRYTAYDLKLQLAGSPTKQSLGWTTHPQDAINLLGQPESRSRDLDGALKLQWSYVTSKLELIFEGVPGSDFSKGRLEMLRIATKKGPG